MRNALGRFTSLAMLATTATLFACGDSPTGPTSSSDIVGLNGSPTADISNPVVLSASGSAHRDGALAGGNPADDGWRTFTFTAQQRHDGTTTGFVQQNRHGGGQIQHGRVFCMAEVGNGYIIIGAEATLRIPENQPSNPLAGFGVPGASRPDNHGLFFVVKDNGEGKNAAPDQFTGYVSTSLTTPLNFAQLMCDLGPNGPLVPLIPAFLNDLEAGNIQVHRR